MKLLPMLLMVLIVSIIIQNFCYAMPGFNFTGRTVETQLHGLMLQKAPVVLRRVLELNEFSPAKEALEPYIPQVKPLLNELQASQETDWHKDPERWQERMRMLCTNLAILSQTYENEYEKVRARSNLTTLAVWSICDYLLMVKKVADEQLKQQEKDMAAENDLKRPITECSSLLCCETLARNVVGIKKKRNCCILL